MPDPRSRVVDFLKGRPVDHPPVVPLVGRMAASINEIPNEIFLSNATQLTTSLRKAHHLFGYDGVVNCFDPTVVSEALGADLTWDSESKQFDTAEPVTDLAAVGEPKDAPERGRLPILLDVVDRLREELGEQAAVFGALPGPFTTLHHLTPEESNANEAFLDQIAVALNELVRAYGHAGVDALLVLERTPPSQEIDWEPEDTVEFETSTLETLANIGDFYDAPLTLCPRSFDHGVLAAIVEQSIVDGVFLGRTPVPPSIRDADVRVGAGIRTEFGDMRPEMVETEVTDYLSDCDDHVFPASGWEIDPDTHPDQFHAVMTAATEWAG